MLCALFSVLLACPTSDLAAARRDLAAPDQQTVLAALDVLAKAGEPGLDALVEATGHAKPYVRATAWAKLGLLGPAARPRFAALAQRVRAEQAEPQGFLVDQLLVAGVAGVLLKSTLLEPQPARAGVPAAAELPPHDPRALSWLRVLVLADVGAVDFASWEREFRASDDLAKSPLAAFSDLRMAAYFAFSQAQELPQEAHGDLARWLGGEAPGLRAAGWLLLASNRALGRADELLPALKAGLVSTSAAERATAVHAAGERWKKSPEREALLTARLGDEELFVRLLAARELHAAAATGPARAQVLLQGLEAPEPTLRLLALSQFSSPLAMFGTSAPPVVPAEQGLPALRARLKDADERVRKTASEALAAYGSHAVPALEDLSSLAADASESVRAAAQSAIAKIEQARDGTAEPSLAERLRAARAKNPEPPTLPVTASASRPADLEAAVEALDAPDQAGVLGALAFLAERPELEALTAATQHDNPFVRAAALLTLGGLGERALGALPALYLAVNEHGFAEFCHHGDGRMELISLRRNLRRALLEPGAPREDGTPAPAELAWDVDYALRVAAFDALASVGTHAPAEFAAQFARVPEDGEVALRSYDDRYTALADAAGEQHAAWRKAIPAWLAAEDLRLRLAALAGLGAAWRQEPGKRPPAEVLTSMRKALASPHAAERAFAAEAFELLFVPRPQVQEWLMPLLKDADALVRLNAARTLRNWARETEASEVAIVAALSDPEPRIRRAAIESFSSVMASLMRLDGEPPPAALPRLIELLADESADVRFAVLGVLPDYGAAALGARDRIRAVLENDRVSWVRGQAESCLNKLAELQPK